MKRKAWLLACGALAATALLVAGVSRGKSIGKDIPAGTGYSALDLCSRTTLSGEPASWVLARYIEPKVQPLPTFWIVESEPRERVAVRTWSPAAHPPTYRRVPGRSRLHGRAAGQHGGFRTRAAVSRGAAAAPGRAPVAVR